MFQYTWGDVIDPPSLTHLNESHNYAVDSKPEFRSRGSMIFPQNANGLIPNLTTAWRNGFAHPYLRSNGRCFAPPIMDIGNAPPYCS